MTGIYIGTNELKSAYVGTTPVKEIYVGTTKVRPSGWQPGANTIAYYPLSSDFNDYSGNSRNLSSNGTAPTIGTYGGLSCAYFGNSGQLGFSGWTGSSSGEYTASAWFWKTADNPQSDGLLFGFTWGGTAKDYWLTAGISKTRPSSTKGVFLYGGTNSSVYALSQGQWYNIIVKREGSNCYLFVNGEQQLSVSKNNNTPNFLAISRYRSGDSLDRSIRGYVSEVIFENKARTAQEVLNYFNQTKSNYGIS